MDQSVPHEKAVITLSIPRQSCSIKSQPPYMTQYQTKCCMRVKIFKETDSKWNTITMIIHNEQEDHTKSHHYITYPMCWLWKRTELYIYSPIIQSCEMCSARYWCVVYQPIFYSLILSNSWTITARVFVLWCPEIYSKILFKNLPVRIESLTFY